MLQVLEAIYLGKATPSAGGGGGTSSGANTSLSNLTDAGKIQAAHLAMPSDVYDELTVVSSGTEYTAPSHGYFWGGASNNVFILNTTNNLAQASPSTLRPGEISSFVGGNAFLPVSKGQKITFYYFGSPNEVALRFIYAVGSESEKQGA